MKDVAILTKYYKNYNYGGMLQGYALHRTILNLGYSADLISYDVRKNANSIYPGLIQQAKQYGVGAAFTKVGEKVIGKGKIIIKDILDERIQRFLQFMEDTNADTDMYNDDTMWLLKKKYRVFVSGSDQIWNPNAVRNLYLQTFISDKERKISYAASIGRDSFSAYEANVMIPAIERFGSIGVRENTAKVLLKKYMDREITTVLDPTMLLSKEEWAEVAAPKVIEEKYVIIYFFSNSFKIRKAAKKFCRRNGLKMLFIPYAKQEYNLTDAWGSGGRVENIGPSEFVSLIRNADFVLTDSFHGAVFSIIHQVPFAVFERNKAGHVSMNSRLYDLLDTFGESQRLIDVSHINELEKLCRLDTEKIKVILAQKQAESIEFLKNAIENGIKEYERKTAIVTITGDEDKCSGCGACVAVCPKKCITLEPNQNGFLTPVIGKSQCIQCGNCLKICPMATGVEKHEPMKVYGSYAREPKKRSASGGLAYIISKKMIERSAVIYGAAFDPQLQVRTMRVECEDELASLQGSKYVQADMSGVIPKVIGDLQEGKTVLFTGTPCQIAGVKAAVTEKNLDRLYTVEIICHGIPSPKMFQDYLLWAEKHYGKSIVSYGFRVKEEETDKDFMTQLVFSDGSKCSIPGFMDPYYKLFLSSQWFRESCYECPFAAKARVADITLGDFWNSEKLPNDFGKGRRISAVLVNTNKGKELLNSVQNELVLIETAWDIAAAGNINIYRATRKPAGYRGYGEIGSELIHIEEETGINVKKFVFHQLPLDMRRKIKKTANRLNDFRKNKVMH